MQPHATRPLDTIGVKEKDAVIQRPHQATPGTQTDNKSEPNKLETTEATTVYTEYSSPSRPKFQSILLYDQYTAIFEIQACRKSECTE